MFFKNLLPRGWKWFAKQRQSGICFSDNEYVENQAHREKRLWQARKMVFLSLNSREVQRKLVEKSPTERPVLRRFEAVSVILFKIVG